MDTPWLGLFGDLDQSIPVEDVEALRKALTDAPVPADVVRYADADHGFHCDAREAYNAGGRDRRVEPHHRMVRTPPRRELSVAAASEHFDRAIAAIDAGNADDPNVVSVRDRTGPKEVLHAELVSEWVQRLRPGADEALQLAARGHHFRRWTVPRASAPAGRAGYLRWRKARQEDQARELGEVLRGAGYDDTTVGRVQSLVRKENLAHDADVQALEDALCLVFLETQLADVAARLEPATLTRVLARTAGKMSDAGRSRDRRRPTRRPCPRAPRRRARTRRRGALPRGARRGRLGRRSPRRSRPTSNAWVRTATCIAAATSTPRSSPTRSARSAGTSSTSTASTWPDPWSPSSCGRRSTTATPGSRRARRWCSTRTSLHITKVAVYLQTSERHPRAASE